MVRASIAHYMTEQLTMGRIVKELTVAHTASTTLMVHAGNVKKGLLLQMMDFSVCRVLF